MTTQFFELTSLKLLKIFYKYKSAENVKTLGNTYYRTQDTKKIQRYISSVLKTTNASIYFKDD